MKSVTVYHNKGRWFGSEIEWKRSGSGFYRETTAIVVPQSYAEIKRWAAENGYAVEWRGPVPAGAPAPEPVSSP